MLNLISPFGKVTKNGLMNRPPFILMNVRWRYNMNYVMIFLGLLILILIPEYADVTHFVLQGLLGLTIFGIGLVNLITAEAENNA